MKDLKKTVKAVKDNKKDLILFGGLFVVGVLGQAVFINKVNKTINNMTSLK